MCIVIVRKKKKRKNWNFPYRFWEYFFSGRFSTNGRWPLSRAWRTRGVFTCRICRALDARRALRCDLATVLLKNYKMNEEAKKINNRKKRKDESCQSCCNLEHMSMWFICLWFDFLVLKFFLLNKAPLQVDIYRTTVFNF